MLFTVKRVWRTLLSLILLSAWNIDTIIAFTEGLHTVAAELFCQTVKSAKTVVGVDTGSVVGAVRRLAECALSPVSLYGSFQRRQQLYNFFFTRSA